MPRRPHPADLAARVSGLFKLVSTPRLSGPVPPGAAGDGMSREALLRELALMSPEEALARTTGHLVGTLAEVTRMDPDQIDPHQRVDGYGLDSLMATTELLLTLQARYEVEIPPMEPLRSATGTLADTARLVHLRLGLAGGTTPPAPALPAPRRNSTSQPGESRVPHQDGTGHETTTAGRRPPPVR